MKQKKNPKYLRIIRNWFMEFRFLFFFFLLETCNMNTNSSAVVIPSDCTLFFRQHSLDYFYFMSSIFLVLFPIRYKWFQISYSSAPLNLLFKNMFLNGYLELCFFLNGRDAFSNCLCRSLMIRGCYISALTWPKLCAFLLVSLFCFLP